jgi:hypothetical protein
VSQSGSVRRASVAKCARVQAGGGVQIKATATRGFCQSRRAVLHAARERELISAHCADQLLLIALCFAFLPSHLFFRAEFVFAETGISAAEKFALSRFAVVCGEVFGPPSTPTPLKFTGTRH